MGVNDLMIRKEFIVWALFKNRMFTVLMILKIKGYEFLEKIVKSSYIFEISYEKITMFYNLIIPTNPLVECEILSFHDKSIQKILIFLFVPLFFFCFCFFVF